MGPRAGNTAHKRRQILCVARGSLADQLLADNADRLRNLTAIDRQAGAGRGRTGRGSRLRQAAVVIRGTLYHDTFKQYDVAFLPRWRGVADQEHERAEPKE